MSQENSPVKLMLSPGRRLALLLCFFIVCYVLQSIFAAVTIMIFGMDSTPAIRIITVLQDIVVFIVPAVATALMVTRRPARLLAIEKRPALLPALMAVATLLAAMPAMDSLIAFNEAIPLPPDVADALQAMEESAAGMVEALTGPHDIPNLLMTILIVGIMAGLSEELLFRGCLQRLLSCGGMNPHAAIWVAAAVFSLLHLQFYGFFPRMVLGAFFGYLLWWTGSVWVPVIIHALNNTFFLIEQYRSFGIPEASGTALGGNAVAVVASLLLTAAGIYLLHRITHKKNEPAIPSA